MRTLQILSVPFFPCRGQWICPRKLSVQGNSCGFFSSVPIMWNFTDFTIPGIYFKDCFSALTSNHILLTCFRNTDRFQIGINQHFISLYLANKSSLTNHLISFSLLHLYTILSHIVQSHEMIQFDAIQLAATGPNLFYGLLYSVCHPFFRTGRKQQCSGKSPTSPNCATSQHWPRNQVAVAANTEIGE